MYLSSGENYIRDPVVVMTVGSIYLLNNRKTAQVILS